MPCGPAPRSSFRRSSQSRSYSAREGELLNWAAVHSWRFGSSCSRSGFCSRSPRLRAATAADAVKGATALGRSRVLRPGLATSPRQSVASSRSRGSGHLRSGSKRSRGRRRDVGASHFKHLHQGHRDGLRRYGLWGVLRAGPGLDAATFSAVAVAWRRSPPKNDGEKPGIGGACVYTPHVSPSLRADGPFVSGRSRTKRCDGKGPAFADPSRLVRRRDGV
jgi:hypothetical protein